jgi:hypothetical protein
MHRTNRLVSSAGFLALKALFASVFAFGCAQHATVAPETEVHRCVGPGWASARIAPHVRTEGAWIGADASQVVHLRGKPDERREHLWLYRSSPAPGALEVLRFSGPRVVSVSVLPGADPHPLCRPASASYEARTRLRL